MLLNWAMLWKRLLKEDRRRGRHPLADPLEGAEWRGLLWIVPLLSWLVTVRPRRRVQKARRAVSKNSVARLEA